MRTNLIGVYAVLLVFSGCAVAPSNQTDTRAIPQVWEPARWERMILGTKEARERGDKGEAERLCFQALKYADESAVGSLYKYADLVKDLKRGDGATERSKADMLRDAKAQQWEATERGNVYLGFAPWEELKQYADLLQEHNRGAEAEAMRVLASAYKYGQEVHLRRTLLLNQGRDPLGEC